MSNEVALVRYNANGSLDTTFSQDGIATASVGPGESSPLALQIQADGKFVIAGDHQVSGHIHTAILRFQANGNLDNTFAQGGKAFLTINNDVDFPTSIAQQRDGKLVFAGGAGENSFVARLRTNGTLDPTFSQDGIAVTGYPQVEDTITDMELQADGKILVVGARYDTMSATPVFFRLNTSGALDRTFDGDGRRELIFDDESGFSALTPLANGDFLAAGSTRVGSDSKFLLCRFTETRPVLTSFVVPDRANLNSRVFLSALASDPNQYAATLVYTWTITGPRGFKVTLKGRNVSFVASQKGTLAVSLVVTDQEGLTAKMTDKIAVL
jgi:uncharacterized delta-60 repeat protein